MALKLITPPAQLPLTLGELKEDLHISFNDNDNKLNRLLNAAVGLLDGYAGIMGRALITQTWALYYDDFPCDNLRIPLGNLLSVVSVEYVDPTTLFYVAWPGSNYEVDLLAEDYGWINPIGSWPSIADTFNATRITFTAGYGPNPTDVPQPIRTAISMLVDMWNEGESPQGVVPQAVKQLLAPFRLRSTF